MSDVPDPAGEHDDDRTPFQIDRDSAGETGTRPGKWGPYHRHFASDAIHRDGGSECDQPGTPRRVYVFDPDALDAHEAAVARWAVRHSAGTGWGVLYSDGHVTPEDGEEAARRHLRTLKPSPGQCAVLVSREIGPWLPVRR